MTSDYATRCGVAVAEQRARGYAGSALDDKVCLALRTGSGATRIERRQDLWGTIFDVEVWANGKPVPEWFGGITVNGRGEDEQDKSTPL